MGRSDSRARCARAPPPTAHLFSALPQSASRPFSSHVRRHCWCASTLVLAVASSSSALLRHIPDRARPFPSRKQSKAIPRCPRALPRGAFGAVRAAMRPSANAGRQCCRQEAASYSGAAAVVLQKSECFRLRPGAS